MITKSIFGRHNGKDIYSYEMTNKSGASVTVITYGAIIRSIKVPDKDGRLGEVNCGFDGMEGYISEKPQYFGALIGRCGNRIDGGFTVDGVYYPVESNEPGRKHLHGGFIGLSARGWESEMSEGEGSDSVTMRTFSPHLEDGYPGNLDVSVTYTWDDSNALTISYSAESDRKTPVNLTNHSYFNLNGVGGRAVTEQEMVINAETYDVVGEEMIPVGFPADVAGTDFDFRVMRKIALPYDHCFQIKGELGELNFAAEVRDSDSGRALRVYTDLPAVQIYTAGGMNGKTPFSGGHEQKSLHAICLETEFSPNTPNRPYMPQCNIDPDHPFISKTIYGFGIIT